MMKRPTKFFYALSLTLIVGLFLSLMVFAPMLAQKRAKTRRYSSVAEANAALAGNPRDARAFRTLADAALNAGDHRKATEEWKKAFEAEPNNEYSRLLYASYLQHYGRDEARNLITPLVQSRDQYVAAEARATLRNLGHSAPAAPARTAPGMLP